MFNKGEQGQTSSSSCTLLSVAVIGKKRQAFKKRLDSFVFIPSALEVFGKGKPVKAKAFHDASPAFSERG
jgi:hypothetical protein